jgi:hypothetical protein
VSHETGAARGNDAPIAVSAMPNAGNTLPGREAERGRGLDERLDRLRVDRLGAAEREGERGQVEVTLLGAP